jgi:hypothetical protein
MVSRVPLRRLTPLLLLLAVVLVPLGGCLPTEGGKYGELRVEVIDDTGAPVRGALVEPRGGWYWPERRASIGTNSDGVAKFTLPVTTYHVHTFPPPGYNHLDPSFPVTYAVVEVGAEPASVTLVLARWEQEGGRSSRDQVGRGPAAPSIRSAAASYRAAIAARSPTRSSSVSFAAVASR